MTPFLAFMCWLFACWMVTILTERPLRSAELQDDIENVNMADTLRLREIADAERREWANLGSDVVTRAVRMRHVRQVVHRG